MIAGVFRHEQQPEVVLALLGPLLRQQNDRRDSAKPK
jgi:hypothetical protein